MLSALLHPNKHRHSNARSSFSSAAFDSSIDQCDSESSHDGMSENSWSKDGDSELERSPLLPIFAADLDSIPVYSLVHSIRSEICSTVDTTLTWEQLRTPQVSSFVVKPILSTLIRMESDYAKASFIYSLMANCLQFRKEAEESPASAGASKTRALLCELLAIKILKEYTARELIDALSYDFYPLKGMPPQTVFHGQPYGGSPVTVPHAARVSALEIAIRAQAKKFLSHPMVIQHLDAIWSGNIVFHSAYDRLHRGQNYGRFTDKDTTFRRSAVVYDRNNAGLFKLSRLRIPCYRHTFSTLSLAILLFLHLRVLMERSYTITPLEVVFWLWSFGLLSDEIADFNESGVSLYFMSMWNAFDFGIFLLFMTFYTLRIIGLFIPEERDYITEWSFDILAASSVFLFPRIFSVLDHYRYFSQLIIAFRIMAADMVALLVVIVVSCSGFFVAFTFSFARNSSANDVSYTLFQILLGFTPAAWEKWAGYNFLGKLLISAFMIITHFVIVTILITVLTNSFAAVAANSVEEHQFLVAVNTISLVKNEAVFTYLAPMNLIAWLLYPLRWVMPFRKFVRLNRTVVKITHFPLLATIYLYERMMLRNSVYTPTASCANSVRGVMAAFKPSHGALNPTIRTLRRKSSMASHQQERVLEQVFAQSYRRKSSMNPGNRSEVDGKGGNVASWMNNVTLASPPPHSYMPSKASRDATRRRRGSSFNRFGLRGNYGSVDRGISELDPSLPHTARSDPDPVLPSTNESFTKNFTEDEAPGGQTGDDADSEGNEEEQEENETSDESQSEVDPSTSRAFSPNPASTPIAKLHSSHTAITSEMPQSPLRQELFPSALPQRPRRRHHHRTNSSNTVLYNPTRDNSDTDSDKSSCRHAGTGRISPERLSSSHKTPRATRPRPIPGSTARHQHFAEIPSSFATQMAMATGGNDGDLLNRLMLAKIGMMEENMKEILGEIRRSKKEEKGKYVSVH